MHFTCLTAVLCCVRKTLFFNRRRLIGGATRHFNLSLDRSPYTPANKVKLLLLLIFNNIFIRISLNSFRFSNPSIVFILHFTADKFLIIRHVDNCLIQKCDKHFLNVISTREKGENTKYHQTTLIYGILTFFLSDAE